MLIKFYLLYVIPLKHSKAVVPKLILAEAALSLTTVRVAFLAHQLGKRRSCGTPRNALPSPGMPWLTVQESLL